MILFAGMIAADPNQGGATWAVLQYLLGFRQLGHEVIFVEPIKAAALRPSNASFESSENARYFQETIREFGLRSASHAFTDRNAQNCRFDLPRTKTKSCSGGCGL